MAWLHIDEKGRIVKYDDSNMADRLAKENDEIKKENENVKYQRDMWAKRAVDNIEKLSAIMCVIDEIKSKNDDKMLLVYLKDLEDIATGNKTL